MNESTSLWSTLTSPKRYFLLRDVEACPAGELMIRDLGSRTRCVDPASLQALEVSEEQAQRWAKDQLGELLDELRGRIDDNLSDVRERLARSKRGEVSSDTTPALLDLLKALPGVIGKSLSGDEQRIGAARQTMANLQQRLKDSGIDVDDRMKGFPDRLASIRAEGAAKTSTDATNQGKPAPDDKR